MAPPDDPVPEPDALDPAADDRLEPARRRPRLGCSAGTGRRRSRGQASRSVSRTSSGPDVRLEQLARRVEAAEEPGQEAATGPAPGSRGVVAGRRRCPSASAARPRGVAQVVEQCRIADLALDAEADDERGPGSARATGRRASRRPSGAGRPEADVAAPGSSPSASRCPRRRRSPSGGLGRIGRAAGDRLAPARVDRRAPAARRGSRRRRPTVAGRRRVERRPLEGPVDAVARSSSSRAAASRSRRTCADQVRAASARSRRGRRSRPARGRATGQARADRPRGGRVAPRAAASATPPSARIALDLADGDGTEPDPGTARPDGRHQAVLVVRAEHDRHAGRRLLERLQERRLGVVAHPVGPLEDRDPGAALDGQQRRDPARGAGSFRPPGGPGCRSGSGRRDRPARAAGRRGGSRDRPAGSRDRPGTAGRPDRGRRRAGRPPGRARAWSCRSRPARRSAGRAAARPATIARTAATAGRGRGSGTGRPPAGRRSSAPPVAARGSGGRRPSCGSSSASASAAGASPSPAGSGLGLRASSDSRFGFGAARLRGIASTAAAAAAVAAGLRVRPALRRRGLGAHPPPARPRTPASVALGRRLPGRPALRRLGRLRERIVGGRSASAELPPARRRRRSGVAGRRLAGLGQLRPEHLLELRRHLAPGVAARPGAGARRARAGPGAGSRCRDRRHRCPAGAAAALARRGRSRRDSG